jgi:hypothetical protein
MNFLKHTIQGKGKAPSSEFFKARREMPHKPKEERIFGRKNDYFNIFYLQVNAISALMQH